MDEKTLQFVDSAFLDCCTHEDPRPITIGQAAEMIRAWKDDGSVTVPDDLTPFLLSRTWNICTGNHMAAAKRRA